MKRSSIDHMELVDSGSHNFFHWLVVVVIRLFIFLMISAVSSYLAAIGFLLSREIMGQYLPATWLVKINFYFTQLPYFQLIKQVLFGQLGHWYQDTLVWWAMVVGLPLMALSISIFLIDLFNLYYSITNPLYSRTHCPFCKKPIRAVKKEPPLKVNLRQKNSG
jgi:hypothetical protein